VPVFAPALFANENLAVGIEGKLRRPEHLEQQNAAAGWTAGGGWRFDKDTHGLFPFASAPGSDGTKSLQQVRLILITTRQCSGSTGVAKFRAAGRPALLSP
jgi:hypothetical protein